MELVLVPEMKPLFPPGPSSLALSALLGVVGACAAFGQLGSTPEDLLKRYGAPTSISSNEAGVRAVSFRKDNIGITAFERDGVPLRIVYRKEGLTDQDVQRLLDLNRGNAEWTPWTPPGISASNILSRTWLRSDDMAMAALQGSELTVTAGAWNLLPPGETQFAAATNAPPAMPPGDLIAPPAAQPVAPRLPKPKKPAVLPKPGDSRKAAFDILGEPRGSIISGSAEIMQYPWGQVTLEQGKIIVID
jgi:hypothetical protein